jgi:hypothetical protein
MSNNLDLDLFGLDLFHLRQPDLQHAVRSPFTVNRSPVIETLTSFSRTPGSSKVTKRSSLVSSIAGVSEHIGYISAEF